MEGGVEKRRDGGLLGPRSFNAITGCPGHLIRVGTDDPRGRQKPKVIAEPYTSVGTSDDLLGLSGDFKLLAVLALVPLGHG